MAQHAEVHARLLQVVAAHGWVPGRPGESGVDDASDGARSRREGPGADAGGAVVPGPAEPREPWPSGVDSSPRAVVGPTESGPSVTSPEASLVEPPDGDGLGPFHARALASAAAAYTAANGQVLEADAFADRPGRRWATRSRVAAVAAAALVVVGGVVVVRAVQQTPSVVLPVAETGAAVAETGAAGATTAQASAGPEVVVHVVGQVQQPGLVHLAAGSRLADAIEAAGGATPEADLAAVNLARVLTDGEQIVVPRPGEPVTGAADAGRPDPVAIDLNTAGTGELDTLPGVGPVIAQRIVDWRTDHGGFSSVEELAEVSGIGPSLLDGVRDLVRVG